MLILSIFITAFSPLVLGLMNLNLSGEKVEESDLAVSLFSKFENNFIRKFDFKIPNKFKNQFIMLVFLYSLIQVIVTTVVVSVFHLKMDDLFLKVAVGFLLLMFILVQTLLINLSQKLKLLIRIYNVRENFSLIITNSRILVPVLLIEGSWIHFIKDSNLGFVSVPFDQIESFVVEPSRGLKRITPPYFKIKIKKIDQVLFLTRKEFYNQENELINTLRLSLENNKIIINDELK